MRAAVLRAPVDVVLEDRAQPTPGRGEVRIRVAVVGVCGSDLHFYAEGRAGSCVVEGPCVLGHEFSGVVDAVGDGVDPARVGEQVSIEPGIACGSCEHCRAGRYNHCAQMAFLGAYPTDGALQELICVPSAQAHPVPETVSLTAAALVEPLSVAVHAMRQAGLDEGGRVLVTGAGPIGLLVADVARSSHRADVTVVDVNLARLAIAAARGATVAPADAALAAGSFDLLVECTGSATALRAHLGAVRRGGTVVLVGVGARELAVPMDAVQEGELTIRGSHRYADTWPEAIELIASGRVDVDALVTSRVPLTHVEQALGAARPDDVKVVVDVADAEGTGPRA